MTQSSPLDHRKWRGDTVRMVGGPPEWESIEKDDEAFSSKG